MSFRCRDVGFCQKTLSLKQHALGDIQSIKIDQFVMTKPILKRKILKCSIFPQQKKEVIQLDKHSAFTLPVCNQYWCNGLGPHTYFTLWLCVGIVCDDECCEWLFYCVTVTSLFQINELCERESHHKSLGIIWIASLHSVCCITEIALRHGSWTWS